MGEGRARWSARSKKQGKVISKKQEAKRQWVMSKQPSHQGTPTCEGLSLGTIASACSKYDDPSRPQQSSPSLPQRSDGTPPRPDRQRGLAVVSSGEETHGMVDV